MAFYLGIILLWFYLCLDEDDEYPTPYPIELFNIVDGRQSSSFWRLSYASYPNGVVTSSIVLINGLRIHPFMNDYWTTILKLLSYFENIVH